MGYSGLQHVFCVLFLFYRNLKQDHRDGKGGGGRYWIYRFIFASA